MKLHLVNGETFDIFRQTTAHYIPRTYSNPSCCRNINPIQLVNDRDNGFFAIGPWGCEGYHDDGGRYIYTIEKFDKLIPIKQVVYISEIDKWEEGRDI